MTTPTSIESPQRSSERAALRASAEFLGGLLVKEVDAAQLEQLREPALEIALSELGIKLPSPASQQQWIADLGAEYHDLFLRPDTGPLVQSLWTQGRYEGDSTVRVRQLADAAGIQFQPAAARGAAVDHLGCLLILWSVTEGHAQAIADEIVSAHLDWATPGLRRISSTGGFYGAIAAATLRLIQELA